MAPSDFTRPSDGFRFRFRGMKLNARPDAIPPDKYALAINVREYEDGTTRTRAGLSLLFQTGVSNKWSTDLRAYAALGTDDLPRLLARNADDTIWLDNGAQVGSLAGAGATLGASMIPFRPNQSPNPYMYIANGKDYQKFSAPSATNVVVQQKVGIKEPPAAPDAYPIDVLTPVLLYQQHGFPAFVAGGTAGATSSGARVSDTIVASFPDPAGLNPTSAPTSLQVNSGVSYQKFMMIKEGGSSFLRVLDVFPAIPVNITIRSIFYFSGTTGRCLVVPNLLSSQVGNQAIQGNNQISSLRRGSLVKIGSEVCFVRSVAFGPDNSICIETSTTAAHTTADKLSGVPAISINDISGALAGGSIASPDETFQVTTGVGTVTATITPNPFTTGGASFQDEDYLHLSINIDNLANLTEMKVLLDVGDGSFTQNFYYFTMRPSDIQAAVANSATQLATVQTLEQRATIDEEQAAAAGGQGLTFSSAQTPPGSSQWAEFMIPLSALTRVGNDQTLSLQTLTKLQLLFNASGTINVAMNSIYVAGGGQADVGDIGAPLQYRIRGRSSVTGAISNPSPASRYGANPRRQTVIIPMPNGGAAYDPQIDTWEIYRYGGSVTSWRFIGRLPVGVAAFSDNYGDDVAQAGDELEFDNFEPWPSIDVPFVTFLTANPSAGGTVVLVNVPVTTNVLRFLPGTLVSFPGLSSNVFTLRSRPTLFSGTVYLFEFEECVSGMSPGFLVQIYEPALANQQLPYMWGPDVNGTVFAVGDPLRPGTLYFSKSNNPDSAPDSYNIEIVQPAEPLLGGRVVDGLGFVASTERWWALYSQPDNPTQRYNFVQTSDTRGLAAPFGHCDDGQSRYWWAKDGIYSSTKGSLTDEDLYNLFPHEGVAGQDVAYGGFTIRAPNYALAPQFRLAHSNGYLYATYADIAGVFRQLVFNLRTGAWCFDNYQNGQVSNVYHVEQTPESAAVRNPVTLFAGRLNAGPQGAIFQQVDTTNDGAIPISCLLATREWDGGDVRAPKQWGDFFVDLVPAAFSGVVATPMSLGVGTIPPATIPTNANRVRQPVSVGGTFVSDFLGLFLQWTDDFTRQAGPTQVFMWQPSFDIQPAKSVGWTTFGTSFGMKGYGHIRQIAIAWVSTAPITLTITTVDGQAPQVLTIPSSGGVYKKQLFPLTANKGQLFIFAAASSASFQIFEDDCELWIGQWGRDGAYSVFNSFGGKQSSQAVL